MKAITDWKVELTLLVLGIADYAQQAFTTLPQEVRDQIPHASTIAAVLFALTLVGRGIRIYTARETADGTE